MPGDVAEAILGQGATPETLQVIRDELGLERPAYVRYFEWLGGLLVLDLGEALGTGRSISELMSFRLPSTLTLGGVTAVIAVPLALSLGLVAAMYPGSLFDRGVTIGTLCVISGPEFLIATLLVLLFAVELPLGAGGVLFVHGPDLSADGSSVVSTRPDADSRGAGANDAYDP